MAIKSISLGALLLGLALAGCSKSSSNSNVQTEQFSFPIPAGFQTVDSPADIPGMPKGAVLLRANKRVSSDSFIGSIVVTPVPPEGLAFDATDPTICSQVAQAMAAQAKATMKGTQIIDGPAGRTCQWEIQGNDGQQAARGIFLKGPKGAWVITCNHDPRDTGLLTACEQVLAAWKFL